MRYMILYYISFLRRMQGIFGNTEKIPAVFSAIDNDLAVKNIENDFDMTAADLQDLKQ